MRGYLSGGSGLQGMVLCLSCFIPFNFLFFVKIFSVLN
ncbi:hypothetical protein TREPR_0975 [Treponema primitia ZAS-2]|uniref:Uncharacterized protein n=1 Tax=Treponema primitia (strain ATCC BAA-887 / DSM 12427 / ZAS-2) TaxID=545694 RepID=F5YI26_TREPZ|nr:hypothetical protein TREPR_0975 [Treponema primitia ZAS-2]